MCVCVHVNEWMNVKNLYSTIRRNAEVLSGKNVSRVAAKKVSFQSLLKSCRGVRVDDIDVGLLFILWPVADSKGGGGGSYFL